MKADSNLERNLGVAVLLLLIAGCLFVLDLSAAPRVDTHSAQMLGSLAEELTAAGIRVQAVEARSSVRERLRGEAVDARLGGVDRFTTVADAVEDVQP